MYLSGRAQFKLVDDVVPHAPRGAGRKRRDRADPGNARAAGSAAGIRDGTRGPTPRCSAPRRSQKTKSARAPATRACPRAPAAPAKRTAAGIAPRAPRESAPTARASDSALFSAAAGIPICASCATWSCISAISGEITITVCSGKHRRGQLVAERFPAARRHHHARIAIFQQAAHDAVLQRTKRIVSPVAAQRREQLSIRNHAASIAARPTSVDIGTIALEKIRIAVQRSRRTGEPQIPAPATPIRIKIKSCPPGCFPRSGVR